MGLCSIRHIAIIEVTYLSAPNEDVYSINTPKIPYGKSKLKINVCFLEENNGDYSQYRMICVFLGQDRHVRFRKVRFKK
jgi:hypothetical protein